MRAELHRWLTRGGVWLFENLGLRTGDRVLDFGCGDGVNSIPASKVVGKEGVVYALDKDRYNLKSLTEKASILGIHNIVPLRDMEGLALMLDDRYLDVVLFFDVIHSYYFTSKQRTRLLTSVSEMVRKNGLISIFPRHMEEDEISSMKETLLKLGFFLEKTQPANLMHDGFTTTGFTTKKIGSVRCREQNPLISISRCMRSGSRKTVSPIFLSFRLSAVSSPKTHAGWKLGWGAASSPYPSVSTSA
jgi:cyclopropane fatty-acyl-phospholipid synthase-like methyltransferase